MASTSSSSSSAASAAAKDLLPREIDEFRSQQYWKRFFEERGDKAFEWYAAAGPVVAALASAVPLPGNASSSSSPRIFVPGCGNSDLSERLYKAGYRATTSMDFDAGVIKAMKEKTSKKCPGLTWVVGDARSPPKDTVPVGKFAAVVDKGLLDAMLPSTKPEAMRDTHQMLDACGKLLQPGGKLIIVSLLQDHVLRELFTRHCSSSTSTASNSASSSSSSSSSQTLPTTTATTTSGAGATTATTATAAAITSTSIGTYRTTDSWSDIELRPLAQPDLSSPLCPFVITVTKAGGDGGGGVGGSNNTSASASSPSVRIHIPRRASPSSSDDNSNNKHNTYRNNNNNDDDEYGTSMKSIFSDSAEVLTISLSDSKDDHGSVLGSEAGINAILSSVHRMQWQYLVWRQLGVINGEAYVRLDLWQQIQPSSSSSSVTEGTTPKLSKATRLATTITAVTPAGEVPDDAPPGSRPRYSVTVVDSGITTPVSAAQNSSSSKKASAASLLAKEQASLKKQTAAVLLVPLGREHEFSFASKEGQIALARQAGVDRLLFVTMGRGHSFDGIEMSDIQAELSPVMITMVPESCIKGGGGSSMPYLAVAENIGWRSVVAEGNTPTTGEYSVEDVADEEEEEDDDEEAEENSGGTAAGASTGSEEKKNETKNSSSTNKKQSQQPQRLVRRLVFMSNKNAVQSEVALKKVIGAQSNSTTASSTASGDATAATQSSVVAVDHTRLCFPYHRAMVAALSFLPRKEMMLHGGARICVVGLGGGGLAMHIATRFHAWARVAAVELDPNMVQIAIDHFGTVPSSSRPTTTVAEEVIITESPASSTIETTKAIEAGKVKLIVGDGLEYVKQLGLQADAAVASTTGSSSSSSSLNNSLYYDVLCIDVDAKQDGMKSGLSFPPSAFVSRSFLKSCKAALAPRKGILLVNLGARSKALYAGVLAAIGNEFESGHVMTIPTGDDGDDDGGDLNCVVVAGASLVKPSSSVESLITELNEGSPLWDSGSSSSAVSKKLFDELVSEEKKWLQKAQWR